MQVAFGITVSPGTPLLRREDTQQLMDFVRIAEGTRSATQNLTLANASFEGVPCRHGNTGCLTIRHLATDTP